MSQNSIRPRNSRKSTTSSPASRTPSTDHLACRLTCLLRAADVGRVVAASSFHVVTAGRVAVLGSGWAAGAGLAGFRRAGWGGCCDAEAAKSAADSGGGEPPGRGGPFPRQAQVVSQRPGEPELGVDGEGQPGPPVGGGRVADLRRGPAEHLLEQAEGVLKEQARLHT